MFAYVVFDFVFQY